jgi:tetratricopeptide (TPR) repeat protein
MDFAQSQAIGGITKDTKFDRAWYNSLTDGGLVASQMRMPRAHFARDLGRQLHSLGERERAQQIVSVLREVAGEDRSGPWWPTLLQADVYLNDRPQALLDLQQALGKPGIAQSQLFGALYPKDFVLAEALYARLGTAANGQAQSLAKIEKLFGPAGFTDDEASLLVKEIAAAIEPWLAAPDYRQHVRGGEIFVRLGDRPRAKVWFEKAAASSTDAYVRLGDLAREDREWGEAIKYYRLACEKLPGLPLPRYLLGHALIQSGSIDEGKREQHKASLTAIAPVTRYALAYQLKERDLTAAAAEEALILQKTANPTVQHPTLAAGHLRANLIMKERPDLAADGWQRWLLSQLSGVNNYTLFDHYLADPELIHRERARALLTAGKADAAITELRRVQIIMPGNARMLEEFVPLLDKAGRGKEAEGLLSFGVDKYEQVIRDFPETSLHRRELALLLARCNRRLDDALALIQQAIKYEPDTAANHDALAEIQFLRRDQAAAIAAGEKALSLEKKNVELMERLAKWKSGK